jgi:hypothetical protein
LEIEPEEEEEALNATSRDPLQLEPPNELTSYRPISLLPIVSKVFEKLLLKRLLPMVENNRLIPNNEIVFRQTKNRYIESYEG